MILEIKSTPTSSISGCFRGFEKNPPHARANAPQTSTTRVPEKRRGPRPAVSSVLNFQWTPGTPLHQESTLNSRTCSDREVVANRAARLSLGSMRNSNTKVKEHVRHWFVSFGKIVFKHGRSVSSFKGKCGIQANWSSRVMLKSKQGQSIETWHVGLCPHATQKDIRHTSHHDWVSTYVPKMVNTPPSIATRYKIPNQRGFPCSYME